MSRPKLQRNTQSGRIRPTGTMNRKTLTTNGEKETTKWPRNLAESPLRQNPQPYVVLLRITYPLLTMTQKRKAQNRAAQRAFRDRKEQHLKDLEVKVTELTRSSETDKQEKGILKAQIDRLETELRDYRTRLSSDANRNHSPTYGNVSKIEPADSTFNFDFPTFGNLPSSQIFPTSTKRESTVSPTDSARQAYSRHSSDGRSFSPKNQIGPAQGERPPSQQTSRKSTRIATPPSMSSFAGLFSPGLLNGAGYGTENNDYGFKSKSNSPAQAAAHEGPTNVNNGLPHVFRFDSGSTTSNNDSPSRSSLSQFNPNSSCGTSPGSSQPSPSKGASQSGGDGASINTNNISQFNGRCFHAYLLRSC